ncbi:sensor histidine kinase [Roseovarius faecimaris]|uniref:histidine kinase n=1 Tax=Roseovarius faecimaris TaxID=2494550 RepID=A0A6I6IJL1_9RHOB|nr:HAMP domain-containing sensor histidine kinase [Roseovarius faecimaris]QGX97009.1 sensor histidine kinase [Roseovarius faecimaris]
MRPRIRQKWRPPLALVIGGTLAAFLTLPMIGIGYFKLAGFILGWGETTLLFFVVALISTLILGFLLWRLVLRPVYALTAHAEAVRDGRDDTPLPPHFGTPEISALGQAMLEMETTLQDREAGLRAYTNHVTHELKSPLTSLIGAAELLEDADEADREALVATIQHSSRRLQELLDALRRLAVAREPVGRGPVRVSDAVARLERPPGLAVELEGEASLPIDAEALDAVLGHLAGNAAAHGADLMHLQAEGATLTVSDNGSGIAPGNQARVFDPFFTTRRSADGTGMGLAIVRTMLEAAGGDITLAPSDHGARFVIHFETL